jgi:hypothetical protein
MREPSIDGLLCEMKATEMQTVPHLLDVVALLSDMPTHGLVRGQVGTVVELLDGAYEVEFSDDDGKTYAELALPSDQLLILYHRPHQAA